MRKPETSVIFFRWLFQKACRNSSSRFAEDIGEHIVQLDVGDGKAVLCAVLFARDEIGELPAIAHQVTELADICRRNKAAGHKVVLENVCDPFGVLLVGFLAANCFDVL